MSKTTNQILPFEPREYQIEILARSLDIIEKGHNLIVELDCGLGKRYLQFAYITDIFPTKKMILLLQASTSLYETYEYLKKYCGEEEITLIDSRMPSQRRARLLREKRIILALPQTLSNTLKKFGDAINDFDIVLINEVDQIIRRHGNGTSIKQPYSTLFRFFGDKKIIGMSGTLRDDHYVMDHEQMMIKKELNSLTEIIINSQLITMDSIIDTDVNEFITKSMIIPTGIKDDRVAFIGLELEQYIAEAKSQVMEELKKEDPQLYWDAKKDFSVLFGPLPLEPKLITRFHQGYLTRKYLWAMSGSKSSIHLIRYGLDSDYIYKNLPVLPGKFIAVRKLVSKFNKSVVLCSFLDAVNTLEKILSAQGFETTVISGEIAQNKREKALSKFRSTTMKSVAILSNVGERDLDIPEAELLIIFDLINTTKTVYQKLKRSRGGIVRVLYYQDTREEKKVASVMGKIDERYSWSSELLPSEIIEL